MIKELFTRDAFKFIFGFLLLIFLSLALIALASYFAGEQQAPFDENTEHTQQLAQ